MTAITATTRFDMGRVISRTFGAIGKNLPVFLVLTLVLYGAPQFALQWATTHAAEIGGPSALGMGAVALLCSMILAFVLQASLVHGTVASLAGKPATLGDGLRTGLRAFLPLFVMSILMVLGEWIGFVALFVPGFMLATRWSVAVPALVSERRGIFGSMGRSADLTKGHRWSIFGLFIVFVILMWVVGIVAVAVTASLNGAADLAAPNTAAGFGKLFGAPRTPAAIAVNVLFGCLTTMVGAAGAAALYSELRGLKDGVSATDLAAVFD